MNLTFSSYDLLNTSLINDEGQVVCRIDSTRSGLKWTSSIIRRSYDDAEEQRDRASLVDSELGEDTKLLHPVHEMAEIQWNGRSSSRVVFGSRVMKITEILTKAGRGGYSFAFTVDGQSYIWDLGYLGTSPGVLKLADEPGTVIARLHKGQRLINARKPVLEIYEEGMHFQDLLLLTFIYTERRRRVRKQ